MINESTTEYNIENYNEAEKSYCVKSYYLSEVQGTVFIRDWLQNQKLRSIRKRSQEKLNDAWVKLAKM